MNFLNPVILFGLIAASIPLILHLLNLRKQKRIEFSSLKFMKELQKTKIRKVRLKQIILLILRTMIIIFIVLAFARPTIKKDLPLVSTYAKSSIVILLDNSFSMDVSDEYGNRFKQAKESVREILKTLRQGDEAVIIPLSTNKVKKYTLSRNFSQLKNELSKQKISYSPPSFMNSISKAYSLLDESNNLNKEIFVVTDGQKNIFDLQNEKFHKFYDPHSSLSFIIIGNKSKMQIENYSVDSLKLLTQIFFKEMPLEIQTTIRNNSAKKVNGLIASLFFNNERKAQITLDIDKFKSKTTTMSSDLKEFGVIKGYIEIESDALEQDNRQYFGFYLPEKTNIALFGNNETLPIETVLKLNESQFNYSIFKPEQINAVNLNNFDLIIVSDGLERSSAFEKLKKYTENGGNLLLFANKETANFGTYKQGLNSLGISVNKTIDFSDTQPLEFNYTDKLHPLFKGVFKGNTDGKKFVESPSIKKIIETNSGQKIISTTAGNFLSEFRPRKGKIFFISSALDFSWNNFTLTGIFPVFIYRSIFYLTAKEYSGITTQVGKDLKIILPKKFTNKKFKIIDPNALEYYKDAAELPSSIILDLNHPEIPGVYTIKTEEDIIVELVSVNHIPSESIISKRDIQSIKKDVGKFVDKRTKIQFPDSDKIAELKSMARTGTELWQLFVLLALLTALAEMLVARTSKNDITTE